MHTWIFVSSDATVRRGRGHNTGNCFGFGMRAARKSLEVLGARWAVSVDRLDTDGGGLAGDEGVTGWPVRIGERAGGSRVVDPGPGPVPRRRRLVPGWTREGGRREEGVGVREACPPARLSRVTASSPYQPWPVGVGRMMSRYPWVRRVCGVGGGARTTQRAAATARVPARNHVDGMELARPRSLPRAQSEDLPTHQSSPQNLNDDDDDDDDWIPSGRTTDGRIRDARPRVDRFLKRDASLNPGRRLHCFRRRRRRRIVVER